MTRFAQWALPGLVFSGMLAFSACSDAVTSGGPCVSSGSGGGDATATTTSGAGGSAGADAGTGGSGEVTLPGGILTSGKDGNTFDHFNDPGESGQKDPFEILKERAEEGPPAIRTRLHSCTKIPYASLGDFLASRGVDIASNKAKSAGDLYKNGKDALGFARFDAREGETYFHTTAGATKLFDIFVQAAPEVIAGVETADACKLNGQNAPMFDPSTGKCVYASLTCIMGRPATQDDLLLCNKMIAQAKPGDMADLTLKRNITVAAFLAGAHTCE
ncbi:MAG: hypothetical protein U0359_16985 [Byssovorax sp.]